MDEARISALLSLEPEDRYWAFVASVARSGIMWGLRSGDAWLVELSPEGFEYLAVWPHQRLAQLVGDLRFPGNTATEITLDDFLATWIDDLDDGGVHVGVFPDADGTFWDCQAVELFDTVDDERQSHL